MPKSRKLFWERKFTRTVEMDRTNLRSLGEAGWDVFVIWECEIGDPRVVKNLFEYLGPTATRRDRR